jgi:hypothetical protein
VFKNFNSRRWIIWLCIIMILLGLSLMWQPFSFESYHWSFIIFAVGGLGYIVIGFIPPGSSFTHGLRTILLIGFIVLAAIAVGILLAPILTAML